MSAGKTKQRRHELDCTAAALHHQKTFAGELRQRVIDGGEAFVVAQADTPHEIFHVMDVPVLVNQWWSSYISAKQLSGRYFDRLGSLGYPANACRYCSLGLACTLANEPETAPWGGLPKPTMLVARLTCDCIQHVFSLWADALDTEFFALEASAWEHKDPAWFRRSNDEWEVVFQPDRIALLVEEMRELIARLEQRTGRSFDEGKLEALMLRINEQESYIAEAARLMGEARPCPVSIAEQMTNTMIAQWHRGSSWAVDHARRFRDEVADRVARGIGSSNERIRLMWIGAGVWHVAGFYEAFRDRLGAVFVWSMYMPFAGPQYIRRIDKRPMEALASRICSMNEVLHLPPWMNAWMVDEADRCGIDAAVMLVPPTNRTSQSGTLLTKLALEEAGVPVLLLEADMVDATGWNHDAMRSRTRAFLEQRELA
jgi:benzoyl-CoA reductase subunit B